MKKFTHFCGSRKRHFVHTCMFRKEATGISCASNDIDNTRWQADLLNNFRKTKCS